VIRRVLAELHAAGGAVDRRQLARRLAISPSMLETVLERLDAAGYVEGVTASAAACRPAACRECPVGPACAGGGGGSGPQRLWCLTEAGRRAAARPD